MAARILIFGFSSTRSCIDLRRAELVAAVDERHALAEPGEVARLLHRRVAAADDGHVLAAEERAVAHGAGADALVLELVLAREAEVLGARAGGDDDRLGSVGSLSSSPTQTLNGRFEKSTLCTSSVTISVPWCSACSRKRCISSWPGHLRGEAGVVLDVGGEHQLAAGDEPAGVEAFEAEGLEIRARRVDGRR